LIKLSGFADEISPDLGKALDTMASLGLRLMELRSIDKVNVLSLTEEHVSRARSVLASKGLSVASIASPIGKIKITDPFEPQVESLKRAVELADAFGTRCIRVFSYYLPKGDDPARWREPVMERMRTLADVAGASGKVLMLENEGELYGDTVERCADIIGTLGVPHVRLVYDPGNLIIVGPRPFTDSFGLAKPFLGYFHVKDYSKAEERMVPAGEGDAEWEKVIAGIKEMGFDGVVALEPHLSSAGKMSGFSGPELFVAAHKALVSLLKKAGIQYN